MLHKLSYFLNRKQKAGVAGLTLMIFIGALLETLGVSAIIPIVQLMMTPDAAKVNGVFATLMNYLHIEDITQVFLFLSGSMICIYAVKNLYLLFLAYVQARFVNSNEAETQLKLLRWYLNRPYEYFLHSDVAVILRMIQSDVQNVFALLLCLMQMLTECMVSVCIGVFLLVTDWKMTLFLVVLLGTITLFITRKLKSRIGALGRKNQSYVAILTKWILQSMNGIKVVKVMEKEAFFEKNYEKDRGMQAKLNTKYAVFSTIPKLLLETLCIGGILAYLMICIVCGGDIAAMAGVMSAFAVAAFRVLPSVSRISTYLANISYYQPSLDLVYDMVQNEGYDEIFLNYVKKEGKNPAPLVMKSKVDLKQIDFEYPNTDRKILDHADMEIPIGASVGIKGPSGAGKTTVVDILLGLLQVQSGEITCDGKNVMESKSSWLSKIGYIPQNVYLTDDTIRENIAFGEDKEAINEARVWEVLREAQLEEFVKELPEGLDTTIGEQGVRISGGQKQRLGIARALYHNPELLVFDEATSALDNDTEAAVMEAIEQFRGRKTMVIIAHRLKTIEKCDIIYEVKDGKIIRER